MPSVVSAAASRVFPALATLGACEGHGGGSTAPHARRQSISEHVGAVAWSSRSRDASGWYEDTARGQEENGAE